MIPRISFLFLQFCFRGVNLSFGLTSPKPTMLGSPLTKSCIACIGFEVWAHKAKILDLHLHGIQCQARIRGLCLYFQVWAPDQKPGSAPKGLGLDPLIGFAAVCSGMGPLTKFLDLHLCVQVWAPDQNPGSAPKGGLDPLTRNQDPHLLCDFEDNGS